MLKLNLVCRSVTLKCAHCCTIIYACRHLDMCAPKRLCTVKPC